MKHLQNDLEKRKEREKSIYFLFIFFIYLSHFKFYFFPGFIWCSFLCSLIRSAVRQLALPAALLLGQGSTNKNTRGVRTQPAVVASECCLQIMNIVWKVAGHSATYAQWKISPTSAIAQAGFHFYHRKISDQSQGREKLSYRFAET